MEGEDMNEDKIVSSLNAVSDFWTCNTKTNGRRAAKRSNSSSWYIKLVTAGEKPKTSAIAKIKSKAVRKYLLQFDRLTLKKGVLHRLYIHNNVEFHQMVLPHKISGASASTASWWPRSSGDWKNYCPLLGVILLEYHVPRCYKICKRMSMMSNCKVEITRSQTQYQGSS